MPSPELIGYTLINPQVSYPVTQIGTNVGWNVKSRYLWNSSFNGTARTLTVADLPEGTEDCDSLVLVLVASYPNSIPFPNAPVGWYNAGTATLYYNQSVTMWFAEQAGNALPISLSPNWQTTDAGIGWYGVLLAYSPGHGYSGSGTYGAYNADSLIYGSPPASSSAAPIVVDGTGVGAAITDQASSRLTLAVPSGYTERVARPGIFKDQGNVSGRMIDGKLWTAAGQVITSYDVNAMVHDYVSECEDPFYPNLARWLVGNTSRFDYDPDIDRYYRLTTAFSGGGYPVGQVGRVEVWDVANPDATQVTRLDNPSSTGSQDSPQNVCVTQPFGATPRGFVVAWADRVFTTGTILPNLLKWYDASTFTEIAPLPAANSTSTWFLQMVTLSGVPYLIRGVTGGIVRYNLANMTTATHSFGGAGGDGGIYDGFLYCRTSLGVRKVDLQNMTSVLFTGTGIATVSTIEGTRMAVSSAGVFVGEGSDGNVLKRLDLTTGAITHTTTLIAGSMNMIAANDTHAFVGHNPYLTKFDAFTLNRLDPSYNYARYERAVPYSICDAQFTGTGGYVPRWGKSPLGPYGAAKFVGMNATPVCTEGAWSIKMLGAF